MKTKPAKRRFRFVSVPVAVVLVLVLTAGIAFAGVYGHKIQELIMPNGQSTGTISLQGFVDSPEYKASAEWLEFEEGYDQDESILDSVGNDPTQWDKKYGAYMVYSQEMADKVDEITGKYDLKLHTDVPDTVGINKLRKMFGNFTSCDDAQGYYYKDGTFDYDGEEKVDGGLIAYQFRRNMKGVFDTVFLTVGDVNKYEQWEYETANGDKVLLALSDDKALIISDLDNSFVAVNVLSGTDEPFMGGYSTVTKETLEALADSFNFSVLSDSKISMDEDVETGEAAEGQSVEAADSEFKFECNPIDDPDAVITKHYGNSFGKMHEGIDIAAPEGTAIHAVADGKVTAVCPSDQKCGNCVYIKHENGWSTMYAHCESFTVEEGASVKAGDVIATVGSTGTSSGPHLHLELWDEDSLTMDPEPYFKK